MTANGIIPGEDDAMNSVPAELFLEAYPGPMRDIANRLRAIVRRATPEAEEGVRTGWHLIGYDVPAVRGRKAYFAFVVPEREHVHLGFEYGVFMDDPQRLLQGEGVTRQVRWLTFRPGDPIEELVLVGLVREAARVALLSRGERLASVLDREARPIA
jgi:hypothetical protein